MKNSTRFCFLTATLAAAYALPYAAFGDTFTVNTTADSGGSCLAGSTTCTLRAAVQTANADSESNNTTVPAGAYLLSQSTACGTTTHHKDYLSR
jgi:CSLREA domain-containing protein